MVACGAIAGLAYADLDHTSAEFGPVGDQDLIAARAGKQPVAGRV